MSFSFHGVAGEHVSYGIASLNPGFVIAGNPLLSLQDSTGHTLGSFLGTGAGPPVVLPATGTYLFVINGDKSSGSGTVQVYGFVPRPPQRLAVGGRRIHVRSVPGETRTFLIDGTAGQTIGVDLRTPTASQESGLNPIPQPKLYDPSGNPLPIRGTYTLAATGTYQLVVNGGLTRYSLRVVSPPDHPDGTTAINGPNGYLSVTEVSRSVSTTFRGRAGQSLTLQTGLLELLGSFGGGDLPTLTVTAPSGATIASGSVFGPFTFTLPSTGAYRITLNPLGVGPGTVGLRLRRSP